MDIKAMAKAAGLSDNDLKGKSPKEVIKLLTASLKNQSETIEIEAAKEYISNYEKKLPELIKGLKEPFEIYVKSIQQKKTPALVKVVGYNKEGEKGEIIVYHNGKYSEVPQSSLVTSLDELQGLLKKPSTKKTSTGKKGTGAKTGK